MLSGAPAREPGAVWKPRSGYAPVLASPDTGTGGA